jgi:hypothetical protein
MPTITPAGAVPIAPTDLLNAEIAAATLLSPGLTANLPGSIIEDIASTAAGAVVVIDQAVSDLINSISPFVANAALLYQLGAVYGVPQGLASNTSVYVTFVSPDIGFVIPSGIVVGDGTNQYTLINSGIIEAGGQSEPLFCVANSPGAFAVPIGTVTQIISSIPNDITLTCINQVNGIPADAAQTLEQYRAQVIQAGQATAQGVPQFTKGLLQKIPGVISNLVSIRPSGQKWEIIVGGGDPYAVANAIYSGVLDIGNLVGSTLTVASVTNAYPGLVTTILNHGYLTGQIVTFSGALGMTAINGNNYVAVVVSPTTFDLFVPIASIVWAGGTVTVVTTSPHGLPTGTSTGSIDNVIPTGYNGSYTFTQVNTTTFTYPLAVNPGAETQLGYTGLDTASFGAYTADSATLSPNLRNVVVDINDPPDIYPIPFVIPPSQSVGVNLTWNTLFTNFVSTTAVDNLAVPALVNYINTIGVGEPINVFDMQTVFQHAVSTLIPPHLISKMIFSVTINGIVTAPVVNTGVIYGDSESYFETDSSSVVIMQG